MSSLGQIEATQKPGVGRYEILALIKARKGKRDAGPERHHSVLGDSQPWELSCVTNLEFPFTPSLSLSAPFFQPLSLPESRFTLPSSSRVADEHGLLAVLCIRYPPHIRLLPSRSTHSGCSSARCSRRCSKSTTPSFPNCLHYHSRDHWSGDS